MGSNSIVLLLWKQLRPRQWVKNFLVFAALLFSFQLSNFDAVLLSFFGFITFSFTASSIYILNDYKDREADRNHPVKKNRPMASGLLNPSLAIGLGVILLGLSLISSFLINKQFCLILLVYFITNVLYSLYLKHVVIIDIMIIAFGFVLRAIGGAIIINVPFTPWFLLCAMLLSLFLAIGKRRHELTLSLENKSSHRKVLDHYSLPFLDQLTSIVSSATIVSYAVFTFTAGDSIHLMWTIPFVIYGIFRYLYLIHIKKQGGAPEKVLFEDRHILVTVILYAVSVVVILTLFE
ncbi:decaprenyl-phosphate phosphoribosyltransferase [Lentibacillus sp. Marseille-P4043]|uniref:decaprenyl-phosphate phosphoribosyltransferase n=1 Tax=Lentibacillus sp. Marseille-P4043 TaxID=2040293 RepID=UPI001F014EAF|nr:decaprenyl-phosphate phosphoribosyltransferase [Lentibacillus sp. Marseille-P4043]